MLQLEPSTSDQRVQAIRDQLLGEEEDRRRPGRATDVSPHLAALLRGEAALDPLLSDEVDPPHGLEHTAPVFGIPVTLIFIMPLLGVLGLVAWAVLH